MTEFIYRCFTRKALDAAYDNTHAVKDSADVLEDFEIRSQKMAREFLKTMDIPYGIRPREKFDYFPGNPGEGIFVFIHGGYWQMRHKNTFRFLSRGPLSLGFHVASVGYTLAPEMNLYEIVNEVRMALKSICAYSEKFQADSRKVIVSGWSAGGHLCAMMLANPCVVGALAISGIYDLEPISKCYLNQALNLSEEDVLHLSPLRIPCVRKPMAIVCGEEELPELQRQSLSFATLRAEEKIPGSFDLLENRNHFTILRELENENGSLTHILENWRK